MPAIAHYPARIPAAKSLGLHAHQWTSCPLPSHAADDTVPTDATGEFDGTSILDLLADGTDLPERDLYWELDGQTAIRRGNYKLVIDGVLRERNAPQTHIHLADLSTDISESNNLADQAPDWHPNSRRQHSTGEQASKNAGTATTAT